MKVFLAATLVLLSGCISVPIPPTGDHMGGYGRIEVGLKFKYFPPDTRLDWFNPVVPQPKLYKEK